MLVDDKSPEKMKADFKNLQFDMFTPKGQEQIKSKKTKAL